jgi:hypothetical protein
VTDVSTLLAQAGAAVPAALRQNWLFDFCNLLTRDADISRSRDCEDSPTDPQRLPIFSPIDSNADLSGTC